jgi:hypothetical protein
MGMPGPVLILPFNDPSGVVWRAFQPVIPLIKQVFSRVVVGVPADTLSKQAEMGAEMRADPFFDVHETPAGLGPGEYFHTLYDDAVQRISPSQTLHLAFPDRIAYALGGEYRAAFLEDMRKERPAPLIFARSPRAWVTHPRNYRRAEAMIADAGELMFKKRLDFAWCHLAVKAGRLAEILPHCKRAEMSFLAELVVWMKEEVAMVEVDWLAWEDPFILGKDAEELKQEREASLTESQKRLSYMLPMIEVILQNTL